MMKKEMIAMLLAGGQGSRLGVLTQKVAKPAVAFGGKYRIIDFPLSNCINSGIDTVGVLTQYQPLRLNTHIGIGIPWDLDRNEGGVTVLPPYEKSTNSEWYTGTANAIFQNLDYMQQYNPDYVLILSGDHIYKMDYEVMLNYHKANKADVTIACMPVPMEEASRFGIMVTDGSGRVTEFEEKPEKPSSNLASMGIYIFSWPVLKEALIALKDQSNCDFGKHILPYCKENGQRLFAYEYNGYWKDVGTLGSYWEANMELIDIIPEFNLYEEFWKIYTKGDIIPPQYIAEDAMLLVEEISKLENVRIRGLMTIAPFVENPEDNRLYFRKIKQLSVDITNKNIDNVSMEILSMGMTGDYEVAIEEGATMVRVGTGIFGARNYKQSNESH